jgi:aminopeptidase N
VKAHEVAGATDRTLLLTLRGSNGRLIEELTHEDGSRTYPWHTAFPISNCNVALNIAPYETITTNCTSVTGVHSTVTEVILCNPN